jgi:osmotically-inducible protein OsmY
MTAGALIRRDPELQQLVLQELGWDSRVDAASIGVQVADGVVTLSGQTPSYGAKLAAQEAAHRVAGVRDVVNEIQVRLPGHHVRTDEDLVHAVRQALEWNVLLPADRIQTTIAAGWVTLDGDVYSWRQRVDAEAAVRHLAGIVGVTNHLKVAAPEVEAYQIRSTIESALERRAAREASRIAVEVDRGTVTLSGWVQSWLEKQAIIGAVGHARGVTQLVDQLRIDPYL